MRILVCDDDPDVGGFLRALFELEGWDAELVTSGADCLAAVRDGDPRDALVLDQLMPGMTGVDTADQLRQLGFQRPIILCSGHLGPELSADIERLQLIPCNKLDLHALGRIVGAAVRTARVPRRPGR